ncbi:FAD-dependent oxidoreductase [Mycobacterium sp.]|uniref:FAD-dependent oxidoreductase n=1 Tax=Mycobacterium sp. TaxID=1785 RepID=UPI002DAA034F|nr:NAD(P)/FAD-dependent oxidoreductase [Mycobacterium sp.]
MDTYDVVIVGARCAGSPLATFLSRAGLQVCLIDQAQFPRETPSTHVIQPVGVSILDRLGVLDSAYAAGGAPITKFTLINDDVRVDGRIDPPEFPTPGLCMRRLTLDALLLAAAAESGVHLRTGCRVTDVITDGNRVAGVCTDDGPIRGRLTVGADGRNSIIAKSVAAGEYLSTPPGRLPAWAYFRGVSDGEGHLRVGRRGKLGFIASPTDSGLYMAGIAVDVADQKAFHSDRERNFSKGFAGWPELADLLSGARREGPIRVMTNWHGYFRQSAGAGWVLVGDAGHFKDFSPAQGISDAFRQAERLAGAIEAGFGSTTLDGEIQRWWRWRDADAYEMYWLAVDMGAPGACTPVVTRLLRDISTDPTATRDLLRVLNHELPPSGLFTTTRLIKAACRGVRDGPAKPVLREIGAAMRAQVYRWRNRPGAETAVRSRSSLK